MESQRKVKVKALRSHPGAGIIQCVKMIAMKMVVVIDPENSKKFTRHSGLELESRSEKQRFIKYAVGDGCAGNNAAVRIIAPLGSYHSLRPNCSSSNACGKAQQGE